MNVLFVFCKDGRFSEYEIYFIETDIYQIEICPLNINPATKLVIPAGAESRNPEKALWLLDSHILRNDGMVDIRWSIYLPGY